MEFIESSLFDTLFGYWGLPLIIVVISGLVLGIKVGLLCFSIWAMMFIYSVVKLELLKGGSKK